MKLLCFVLVVAICIPAIPVFASANAETGYYASSEWNNPVENAFDNNPATQWAARPHASKGTEWIYTMFDEYGVVDSIQIVEKGHRIGAYEIQYYDETGAWVTCHTGVLNETCDKTGNAITHPVISLGRPVNCKGIRFNILGGSDASPGMYEFKMFYAGITLEDGKINGKYHASSKWNDDNSAQKAFDNDKNTSWSSAAGTWSSEGTEWISALFDEYGVVDSVQIIEKGKRIGAYEIQYYDETGAWTTVHAGVLNESCDKSGSTITHPVITFAQPVTCKGIRFNILGGSDASPGMCEFKMFNAGIPLKDGQIHSGYYASSDDGNPVKHAFDAVDTTRWSASASENQWICALYDNKFTMDSVEIIDAWGRLTSFEIQYFDENGTWQTCASRTGESTGVDVTHELSFAPVTTTGIRLYMPNTPGWPSIYELKMFYEGVQLVNGKLKEGTYGSSSFAEEHIYKAFDNDPATRWSASAVENQWIVASYDNRFTFDSVEILEFRDRMNSFEIQYIDENGIWQTCASKTIEGADTGKDTAHTLSFDPVTTYAVRLYIPDAPGWASIYEVKLFYTGIQIVDGQLAKGYYASSIWNASSSADKAFDNDVSTQWGSKSWSSKGTEWICKIFDAYVDIDEIQIIEKGHRIGAYEIQYIDETGAWKTCYTGTMNETCDKTGSAVTQPAIKLGKPITCKGIRLYILDGSDASPGVFDFKTFYFDIPVSDEKINNGYYSSSDDGNTVDKAFDNDPATRWSAIAEENQWICTFFDQSVTIDSVEIIDAWGRLDSFEIQYVDENKQWKTCASKIVEGEDTGEDVTHQLSFDPVTTTGMRLYIHSAPGWASIYEFKMFYTGIQVIDGKIPAGFYSSTNDGNLAENAFDCKLDTRWSASAEKDQWVSAFYEEAITIDAITIKEFWDRMNSFELQYYDANGVWQTFASKTITTEDTGIDTEHSLSFKDITTRGVRVFIPDAPGWPSIYEVQLFHDGFAWIDVEKKPSDYSIALIPDQQCLTDWHPDMLYNMYQWIGDNAEKENMQMVINVGDITNYPNQVQWERAKYAYDLLQNRVPYIAVPGNHDYNGHRDTTNMNVYFPLSMFKEMETYGGSYTEDNNLPDDVANTWQAFEVNGNKYLVLGLEYGPRDSVLAWANEVVAAHPSHQVIVVTHAYMNNDGTILDGTDSGLPTDWWKDIEEGAELPNNPEAIWDKFVKNHKNIVMVLSGHIGSRNIVMRTDVGVHGNEVKQFLIDAQFEDPRLDMVAMLNFSNDGQDVEVTYYCPSKGKYMNYENQFMIHLPKQEEAIAQVGEQTYVSVAEAVANANGQVVKLLAGSDEAIVISDDVTIDLAGFSLNNVTVASGSLNLIDTVSGGSAVVTGNVPTMTEADGKSYYVANDNGVYSAHSYEIKLTHISLDSTNDALGYKAELIGDDVVKSHVKSIGFNLWVSEDMVVTKTIDGKTAASLRLKNILKSGGGEMIVYGNAFVIFDNEQTVTSANYGTTMKEVLQAVNTAWNTYATEQRTAVKTLCDQYYTTVSAWELDNIYPVSQDGTVKGVYEVVTGDVSYNTDGIQTTADNSLMLHTSANFTEGTLGANVKTSGSHDVGILFGANADCSSYYMFRVSIPSQYVELVKVENGKQTVLDRGHHICAGTIDVRLEVVINDGTAYCYYLNNSEMIKCYSVTEVELFGDRIGLWASTTGTSFRDVTITSQKEKRTADVLIFGHSYTEMWTDYASYFPEYTSMADTGIGGSVAAHWEELADDIISYEPKLGIYIIGINDLSAGITPNSAVESMENALLNIKEALPEFEVVVVSVNHCPTKGAIADKISEINALMRNLAASYDWIYYAETEYLFCTDKSDPLSADPSLFIDGLHPAPAGYALLAEVIRSAAKGENQPALDEALAQTQLEKAKTNKLASLNIYSENAYTAENWALAQSHYGSAVAKIEVCTTTAQLKALDLSTEIAALQAIPNKSANLVANLTNADTRDALSADSWIKVDDNTLRVGGGSYALDHTTLYTDSELVFRLTGNTGNVGVGGIFLRATQNTNNGVDGYLINYSTESDLLQVWYVENAYNTDGTPHVMNYLGGIIYGSHGSVVDTEFYTKIEGDKLYVNTLARHMDGRDPLFEVDLTGGGQYQVFQSGYTGVLSWNSNVTFDLEISHVAG